MNIKTVGAIYRWLPSLYVMQGLPFALATSLSVVFFKSFHFNNTEIAFYTSLFSLPLFLKPLFAPLMENIAAKKIWILSTSLSISVLFLFLAICINFENFFYLSILIFFAIAFSAMLYDTNVDGFYIDYLDKSSQAHFIGVRTLGYQIGNFTSQGGAVLLAGLLFAYFGVKTSWQITLILLAFLTLILTVYHYYALPKHVPQLHKHACNVFQRFTYVIKTFLAIPNLTYIIMFIFVYQMTENQLQKIVPLFLLDTFSHGGLALSTIDVGTLNGMSVISMVVGVLVSGFILVRIPLNRCLLPFSILSLSALGYVFLSFYSLNNFLVVTLIIVFVQFCFGITNGIYMLYLLHHFRSSQYSMSLYAIGTSLMGFSMFISGAMSGYLQFKLGYTGFFIWIIVINILVILFTYLLVKKNDLTRI